LRCLGLRPPAEDLLRFGRLAPAASDSRQGGLRQRRGDRSCDPRPQAEPRSGRRPRAKAKLGQDYERENVPEPKPVKGCEALRFLLEEDGLTAGDLAEIIGVNRSILEEVDKSSAGRNRTAE